MGRAGPKRIRELVLQLGDDNFKRREEASRVLVQLSRAACGELRRQLKHTDLELRTRAKTCLDKIEARSGRRIVCCMPSASWANVGRRERLRFCWRSSHPLLTKRSRKPRTSLSTGLLLLAASKMTLDAALADRQPARRAVAACLLGRAGGTANRKVVCKLLEDADVTVQLRAAQGLLAGGDASGLAVRWWGCWAWPPER